MTTSSTSSLTSSEPVLNMNNDVQSSKKTYLTEEQATALANKVQALLDTQQAVKDQFIKETRLIRNDLQELKQENKRLKFVAAAATTTALICLGFVFGPMISLKIVSLVATIAK